MNSFRKNMIIPVAGVCIILFLGGCTPGKAQTRGNDYKGSFQNEEFETFDPGNSNWDDRIPPYDRAQRGSDDQRYNNSSDYNNNSNSYNDRDSRVSRSNGYSDSPVRNDFQQNPYGGSNEARGGFVRNSGVDSNEFREDRFFQKGPASWYGREFHGKTTASGERFDMNQLTAAHKTLPFGSIVEVRNLENGKSVRLKINDRGPYRGNRIIDVSFEAARALDMVKTGEASVGINVIHMGDNSTAHQSNAGSSYVEPVSDRGLPLNVNRYDSGSRYESSQGYSSDVKLQAGAFYSRRNAENLRDRIQSMTDMPVKVIQDGDFYKVRVEGLQSKYEADRLKNSLYNSNISSFVVE